MSYRFLFGAVLFDGEFETETAAIAYAENMANELQGPVTIYYPDGCMSDIYPA